MLLCCLRAAASSNKSESLDTNLYDNRNFDFVDMRKARSLLMKIKSSGTSRKFGTAKKVAKKREEVHDPRQNRKSVHCVIRVALIIPHRRVCPGPVCTQTWVRAGRIRTASRRARVLHHVSLSALTAIAG